jgi:hypothetical protein
VGIDGNAACVDGMLGIPIAEKFGIVGNVGGDGIDIIFEKSGIDAATFNLVKFAVAILPRIFRLPNEMLDVPDAKADINPIAVLDIEFAVEVNLVI